MRLILALLLTCTLTLSFSQSPWLSVNESQINDKGLDREVIPRAYHTFSLDFGELSYRLSLAPMEDIMNSKKSGVRLQIPLADGELHMFDFVESPCMSPVLSAKYPHIRSYRGVSLDGENSVARIDISKQGFRGAIKGPAGTVYIDPYYEEADGNYISYYVADHKYETDEISRTCSVEDYEKRIKEETLRKEGRRFNNSKKAGEVVIKTTYRFALACTGAWGTQQGGTKDIILSKMNSGVNRLNSLLEDEVAMKFELIDNNDQLIFFGSADPYNNPNHGGQTLGQNTGIINGFVGEDAYDVGHVFTIRCDEDGVGGIANGSSACGGNKGAGVSCVGNSNLNNFMVTTTAHEIGHQFSAGHTFNNCPPNQDQLALTSACEPGSGSTILSYLGACGDQNLSGGDINIYHVCTLDQIKTFVAEGGGSRCGSHLPSDNHHPEVWIEQQSGFVIPIATPFELTGDASDMDGDEMVYSWEQIDLDFPADVGAPTNNVPSFRVYEPNQDKTRIFPRLSYVLNGNDWKEERLPTYSRELTFNFVARDDNPLAGGVNWATVAFEAHSSAGPFLVTEPGTFITTKPGKTITVEWDVANTDNDIINCQYVDIYFSDDAAQSFPYLVKARTANDGSEVINIPNAITQNGKVKVKGNESAFFNINRGTIRVEEPTEPSFFVDTDQKSFDICLPNSVETMISGTPFLGFSDMINLEIISGLPANATATFSQNPMPADGTSNLAVDLSQVTESGTFNIVVQASAPGVDTLNVHVSIEATGVLMDDFVLQAPLSGTTGITALPDFSWNGSINASGFRFELATNPGFAEEDLLIQRETGLSTELSAQLNLENSQLYYWRAVAYNPCLGEVSSEVFTFSTIALSCSNELALDLPINISSSGTPTIESKINMEGTGIVTDVNVGMIKGNHKEILSLRGSLISPSGTSVILWQGGCLNEETIFTGFDDTAAFPNGCPNTNGQNMKPRSPLSKFIGEEINGDWVLKIEDTESGNGGRITDFILNLCSDAVLDSPFLVNNEVLPVGIGKGTYIQSNQLLSEDNNNTAEELIYTIVEVPTNGDLRMGSSVLRAGAKFSQALVSSGAISYKHNGTVEEEDSFIFTVIDGEGGWIDKTRFVISAAEGNPSTDVTDLEDAASYFEIYPNPTQSILSIEEKSNSTTEWHLQLMTLDGQLILENMFSGKTKLNLDTQSAGMYLLKLDNGEKVLVKKVVITK